MLSNWGYSQALIVGKFLEILGPRIPVSGLSFIAHSLWLAAHLALAALVSTLVEGRGKRLTLGCWRRACLSWVGIVILYSLIVAILIALGYLQD
jgi:hypothetical protein